VHGDTVSRVPQLVERAKPPVREVLLALPATVEGQSTAHYVSEQLAGAGVTVSTLARGVPVGGELDYLDEGTLAAAIKSRRTI
jgi:recombination protein RecR